jgi:hypothetical protein
VADPVTGAIERAATEYAASALRALEGTAFESLGVAGLSALIEGLCNGLGVGAIGVMAADTGIAASEGDVAIVLEVLRTGLDQVCEDKVVIDLTSIYLGAVAQAASGAGATDAYDEIAAIRAAPVVCDALRSGSGAEVALLGAMETLYGIRAASLEGIAGRVSPEQGVVAGAVLAAATAIVCPEHLSEVELLLESL